ncbi:MAG: tyrosine-type recombinase/integrase [Terriglobales bacterium]
MALGLLEKRRQERRQGRKLPETIRRRTVPFSELLEDAAEYGRSHHQLNCRTDSRAALLRSALGSRPADAVTPQEIEAALAKLATERNWEPGTRNRHHAFISLAYRLGIENGKVAVNPARMVRRKRENSGRILWLSADQETKLTAVIEQRYPAELPAFRLALHTGMRRSEQYRLTWDCVDFEQRQVTIPKTKNGTIRYVPLDDTAVSALLALRDRGNGAGPVMVSDHSGHGYAAGHALKTPREWFAAACRLADMPDFTWHCLRHSFASRLIMAGAGLRTVQELMGHKTIAMTCRYAHLAPQHQLDAVRMLDGWGRAAVALPGVQSGTRSGTGAFEAPGAAAMDQRQPIVQ